MSDRNTEPRTRQAVGGRRNFLGRLAGATTVVAGLGSTAVVRATAGDPARTGERGQDPPEEPSDLVFFSVGAFDCTIVSDGVFAYQNPIAVMFSSAPREEVADALRERGIDPASWEEYVSPYSPLLVETGDRTLLVDTGAGDLAPTTGRLLENLHTASVAPGDVDVVFLTHGHPDHIGGTVDADGNPAFPNARYVVPRREWEFWTGDPDLSPLRVGDELKTLLRQYPKAKLSPLEGRVELVDGESELVPGVTAIPAGGHTPGHFAVEIASEDEQFLHLADAALHPLHVPHSDWLAALDYAPDETVATRRELYARAARTGTKVLGYHFPSSGLGRVRETPEGWRWDPVKSG